MFDSFCFILSINANADGLHLRLHLHRRNIRREFYAGLTTHTIVALIFTRFQFCGNFQQMAEIEGNPVHVCDNCIVCVI